MSDTQTPEEKVSQDEMKALMNSVLGNVHFATPEHIFDCDKPKYVAQQRSMIGYDLETKLTSKKNAEGDIAYYVKGEIQVNPQNGKLLTVEEIVKRQYASYLTPSKNIVTKQEKPPAGESFLETKAQVLDYLKKKFEPQGILQGHAKWNAEYTRIINQQGITN